MKAEPGVPWRALIGGSMNSTMVFEQLEFWFGSTSSLTPPPPTKEIFHFQDARQAMCHSEGGKTR
jgi:hypothetical protein